jgi:hypothetical protein
MSPVADLRPVLRAVADREAAGVDADHAVGPVLARARRLRRRRRVGTAIAALVVLAGGGAVAAAVAGGSAGEQTSTFATQPSVPTSPSAPSAYRIWVSTEEQAFPEVGLTLEATEIELGPWDNPTYSAEVYLRADRAVEVESIRIPGRTGIGARMCFDEDDRERVCDEPDRSVDGDGWSLLPGGTVGVTFFVDTSQVAHGAQMVLADVVTDAGTIEVPIRIDVLVTDEPVPPPESVLWAEGSGPGTVRLRPADWRASLEAGAGNDFSGAPYTVVDEGGTTISTGNAGTYGEAILTLEPGTYTIRIDTLVDGRPCGFTRTVTAVASEVLDVEPVCSP